MNLCAVSYQWQLSPQFLQMSFVCKNLSEEDLEFLSQPSSAKDSDFIPSYSSPPDSSGSTSCSDSSQVIIERFLSKTVEIMVGRG